MSDRTRSKRLRVGAVSYLNTKPLVYRLEDGAPDIDLTFDLPSRLAERLAGGQLDVALIPSIEVALGYADYTIVSDACIACRGPVLSVKLFSRVPFSKIRRLALDEGSRTSAVLVQILLSDRFGARPRIESLPIGCEMGDSEADAVLLIGDRAIHGDRQRAGRQWDLGEEWCRATGLPFVFAMWAARRGLEVGAVAAALSSARDAGVARLGEIARQAADGVGMEPRDCYHYLRHHLHFYLGADEQRGLHLFLERAAELGLLPHRFRANELDFQKP
jgi:chorismate dehydratase